MFDQSPVLLLNQEEREEDLPPVFDAPVDSTDLESVFTVMNLEFLVTIAAFEQVSRRVLSASSLVINADLSILEPGCVVEPIAPLWYRLFHISSLVPT